MVMLREPDGREKEGFFFCTDANKPFPVHFSQHDKWLAYTNACCRKGRFVYLN